MELLSKYITAEEFKCKHCGRLPQHFEEERQELFAIYDQLVEILGEKPVITSGYRCFEHQINLLLGGYKAAVISPHNFGVALDIKPPPGVSVHDLVKTIEKINPDVRLGFRKYGGGWLHMDVAYLLKERHIARLPASWKRGVRW